MRKLSFLQIRILLNVDIADYIEMHVTEKSSKESTEETLKWVCIYW